MRNLFYIIAAFVLGACNYPVADTQRLDRAQALIDAGDAAGAFGLLNAMDIAEIDDSAQMARWALLYSESMVAQGLPAPTDTIAAIAVDYYSVHADSELLHRATKARDSLAAAAGRGDELSMAQYMQKEKEFYLYRMRVERDRIIVASISVLFMALALIVWLRMRMRYMNERQRRIIADASAMCSRTADAMNAMEVELRQSLGRRFALIDSLCSTYYESRGSRTELKAIAAEVKAHITGIKDDPDVFAEMERTIDGAHGSLLSDLRAEFSSLSAAEYRLYVYLACGLSARSISLLFDESIETMYKRKSRLKKKLALSPTPRRADYLSVF